MNRKASKLTVEFDPLAQGFSAMIEGPQFDAFCQSIGKIGQQFPIIAMRLPGGKIRILDGRRRWFACQKVGIKPKVIFWNGKGAIADLIAAANLHRRQLSDDQRAIHTAQLYCPIAEQSKLDRAAKGGQAKAALGARGQKQDGTDNRALLAREAGISIHKLRDAIRVWRENPEAARQVAESKLKLAQALRQVEKTARRSELETLAKLSPPRSDQWEIRAGDCLKRMEEMPAGKCRLIFCDPRYNIGISYGRSAAADRTPEPQYLEWCRSWMSECKRLLTPDGSIFVMIDHSHTDHFGVMLRESGLHFRSIIVWYETGATYKANNFTALRFVHYYTRDPQRFIFNAHEIKIPSWRNVNDPSNLRTDKSGRLPPGLWGGKDDPLHRLPGNSRERIGDEYPTQLPVELLDRIVKCASEPGDLIFDPFTGSGTTGVSAILNGRRFIGTEINRDYVKLASQRLRAVAAQASAVAERKIA